MSPSLLVGTTIAVFLFNFRFSLPKLQEQMTGFDERLIKYINYFQIRCFKGNLNKSLSSVYLDLYLLMGLDARNPVFGDLRTTK